jgi:hypothetical protein
VHVIISERLHNVQLQHTIHTCTEQQQQQQQQQQCKRASTYIAPSYMLRCCAAILQYCNFSLSFVRGTRIKPAFVYLFRKLGGALKNKNKNKKQQQRDVC